MSRCLMFVIVMLAAVPAAAQERPRAISLRDAISLAARNNPALAAAAIDLRIADASVLAAAGVDDFRWDVSAIWNRSKWEFVPGNLPQQTSGDDVLLSTTLTRALPTGGEVGLRVSTDVGTAQSVVDYGAGSQASSYAFQAPAVRLFASHPLLRGAGVDVARAQRRLAAVARDVAGLERDASAALILRNVVVAYWNAALAAQEVEIYRTLAESARQQLAAVEAAISAEKQPASASAEVKVAVALREDGAISAEQALQSRWAELARIIGVPFDPTATGWALADKPDFVPEAVSFESALSEALAHNPQLAAIQARGQGAAIEVDVGRNGMLPLLDVSLIGEVGNTNNADVTWGQLGNFRTYGLQAGLLFQEPIGHRAGQGALDAADAQLHKAKLLESDIAAQIRSAVAQEVGRIDAAGRRVEALGEAIENASLDLAAERARFEVGRAVNFDVLRRQEEVAQAKFGVLHARIDYLTATAALDALTGNILGRVGAGGSLP